MLQLVWEEDATLERLVDLFKGELLISLIFASSECIEFYKILAVLSISKYQPFGKIASQISEESPHNGYELPPPNLRS